MEIFPLTSVSAAFGYKIFKRAGSDSAGVDATVVTIKVKEVGFEGQECECIWHKGEGCHSMHHRKG